VGYVKSILKDLGINPGRVEMFNMSAADGPRFVDVAREFTERIKALGPSPVKTGKGSEPTEEVFFSGADAGAGAGAVETEIER
jgi:hypothetical protein